MERWRECKSTWKGREKKLSYRIGNLIWWTPHIDMPTIIKLKKYLAKPDVANISPDLGLEFRYGVPQGMPPSKRFFFVLIWVQNSFFCLCNINITLDLYRYICRKWQPKLQPKRFGAFETTFGAQAPEALALPPTQCEFTIILSLSYYPNVDTGYKRSDLQEGSAKIISPLHWVMRSQELSRERLQRHRGHWGNEQVSVTFSNCKLCFNSR